MIRYLAAAALSACLLAGCDGAGNGACDTIKIGVGVPLSGGSEGTGQNVLRALSLAADDVNAAGGVNGKEIELIVRDDGSGVIRSVVRSAAKGLSDDECTVAVVGHLNSDATLWAQDVYSDVGIVNYTAVSTASSIAANSRWTFRNITHNGYKGRFLAEYAKEKLGLERVGIIYDDDAFGTDLKEFFEERAAEIGLEIVGQESYSRFLTPNQISTIIGSAVSSFLEADAQAVYASGVLNEGVMVVNEVRRQAGAEMPIIWSGWEEPLLIEEAGTNAEGVTVPIHRVYDDSNPAVVDFNARFRDRFGVAPGAFAPFAYDALQMLAEAIRAAGTERSAVRDYLAGIDTPAEAFVGLTGHIYFDEDGDLAEHFVSALVVKNGQFVPAED